MTGWRCGWAVGPAALVNACNAIQSHSTSNVCSITQKAVEAGAARAAGLHHRDARRVPPPPRSALRPGCRRSRASGCGSRPGAFYLFPGRLASSCRRTAIRTSADLAAALLNDAHVALTPGEAFDAPGFLRISYATSMKELERGSQRILEFLATRAGARAASRLSSSTRSAPSSARSTSAPTRTSRATYGADALKRGRPADVVVLPDGADEVSAILQALRARTAFRSCRAAAAPAIPAARCRIHGGVVLSLERMNRILEIDEENLVVVVEPQRDHRHDPGRGRAGRPVLSAGSRVAADVGHRRQRRRVRRRAARVQVRDDEAVRPRAAGRAAQRRHHRNRRQGREERRRLRPDAPAGRIRRHARGHHADHPAAGAEAAGAVDAARDVRGRSTTRRRPSAT